MTRVFSNAEIVAILSGLSLALLTVCSVRFQNVAMSACLLLALGMVVWITLKDVSDYTIPDGPLICIAAIGVASRIATVGGSIPAEAFSIFVDASVCGGALLAIREFYFRFRGMDGIGLGDVKLAAVGGILVGIVGFAWALFLASVAGLAAVLVMSLVKPGKKIDRVPFGAFLAPTCWCLWVVGTIPLAIGI